MDITDNTWMLLIIAILNAVTAGLVLHTRRNVQKIETATNSMKDALIAATARASHAEGREEMRKEQHEKD